MILHAGSDSARTLTINAGTTGWTSGSTTITDVGTSVSSRWWWKIATASEPATYSVDLSAADNCCIAVTRYTGHHATTPIDASSNLGSTSAGTAVSHSVTSTVANCLIVGLAQCDGNRSFTPTSPLTEEYDHTSGTGGGNTGQTGAWRTSTTAGSYATEWTLSFNDDWVVHSIAIAPAASATNAPATVANATVTAYNATAQTEGSTNALATVANATVTAYNATVATGAFTPALGHWRWYDDATPDGSMSAMAAEDATATLTGPQMRNGIARLRAQIVESGGAAGSGTLTVQWSDDGTNWLDVERAFPNTASAFTGSWFRYGNGAATEGGAIGTPLLTGTDESGIYIEDNDQTVSVGSLATHELDVAIYCHWPTPDSTLSFRLLLDGTPLTGAVTLNTSTAAVRTQAIRRLEPAQAGGRNHEIRFSPWQRLFHDGTRWWAFTLNDTGGGGDSQIAYQYWDGPGSDWSSVSTTTMTGSMDETLHAVASDGAGTFYVIDRASSSPQRFKKGTVSGTTITWGAEESLTQTSDRFVHGGVDDGGYLWIAGNTAGVGVWVRRSVLPGDITSWAGVDSVAASGVASGDIITVVGLASNRCLVVWFDSTNNDLLSVKVGPPGTVGAVRTISSGAHSDDWGLVRSNGWVYCAWADGPADEGQRRLSALDETGDTWAACPTPTALGPGPGLYGIGDGLPLSASGDDVYLGGVGVGSEGGQDRTYEVLKYTGPGTTGSWAASTTKLKLDAESNLDFSNQAPYVAGGKLLAASMAGDPGVNSAFVGYTWEYYTLDVPTADPASISVTAFDATVQTAAGTDANAEVVTASITAADAAGQVDINAENVTASITAADAASQIDVNAEAVSIAITAFDTTVDRSTAPTATEATISVTAFDATVLTGAVANAEVASISITAMQGHRDLATPSLGAFYYPWFPETWTVGGFYPKDTPLLGYYDLDAVDAADTYDQHIAWLEQAGVKFIILSWWGQGQHNEDTRIPLLLDRIEAAGSDLMVCMYYESEGFGDPSSAAIQADLDYLATNYADRSAYLWRDNAPVVFVYNSGDIDEVTNCLSRWDAATNGFVDWYVVAKVFTNYTIATPQPNSWHQYGPATREDVQGSWSYTISPGYHQADDVDPPGPEPYLVRDFNAWHTAVDNMRAAAVEWQLVTTFNEWGEGTAIEPGIAELELWLDVLAPDRVASDEAAISITAFDAAPEVAPTAGSASISVTAFDATVQTTGNTNAPATVAAISVAAQGPAIAIDVPTNVATAALSAYDGTVAVGAAAESPAIPVTAFDATAQTTGNTNAPAEGVTIPVTAFDATVQTTGNTNAPAEGVTIPVTAFDATAQVVVDAGAGATAITVTAFDATAQTTGNTNAPAEGVAISATAFDATVDRSSGPSAELVSISIAALAPAVLIAPEPGTGAGVAISAFDATVQLGKAALAEVASITVAASDVSTVFARLAPAEVAPIAVTAWTGSGYIQAPGFANAETAWIRLAAYRGGLGSVPMGGVPMLLEPQVMTVIDPIEGGPDAYGNTTYDYDFGARREIIGWLQQDQRAEGFTPGRDPNEERWLLITGDTDIGRLSQIEWLGHPLGPITFTVEGPPEPAYRPGGFHHTEITLRRLFG